MCLLMTMHCVWYWITCTAQLYYSHVSASVIATRWILTKSPRCDGINLCRGVVRSEPGGVDQYSSYCSVFQTSSFKLKAVFRYTRHARAVSNTSRSLSTVCCWISTLLDRIAHARRSGRSAKLEINKPSTFRQASAPTSKLTVHRLKTIAVNKVANRWRNHNNKTTKISELNKIIELYEL